ncbi:hypothetical protein GOBAR_AA34160 [Gossypium barbadense]|uniref:Uncharacterized protein n=1 Tax=Gossypium barbadense TaxID=3634 RepID=A0A2P5W629_GOSBA|nr:hypothetical protein GOBAR_AA34160 [Gossypium barbadense]
MALNRRGNRLNSIIDDLTEAVELSSDNVKVFCLLGKCYEMKKMKSEAKAAFKEAVKTEPSSYVARAALHRLRSLYNSRYIIHLLAQARSSANSLAKQAESETNKAVSLDPKDAAPYTLKAFAVDLQGFKTSALHSLNVALSPLTAKSLTDKE